MRIHFRGSNNGLQLGSFIHSGHFYSAFSSPLLLRSAPNTARILCRRFTLKRHRQLRVKDLPKVPAWWLEWDSNLRPSKRKAANLPLNHHNPPFSLNDLLSCCNSTLS